MRRLSQRGRLPLKGGRFCASGREPVEAVAAALSRAALLERQRALADRAAALKLAIAPVQSKAAVAQAKAKRNVTALEAGIFTLLGAQFMVLFNWVFFVFDWNLVEPVTYFLGYSCTWFGIMFYAATGVEWSYDSTRAYLQQRQLGKLLRRQGVDAAAHDANNRRLAAVESAMSSMNLRD